MPDDIFIKLIMMISHDNDYILFYHSQNKMFKLLIESAVLLEFDHYLIFTVI
jgi:hypothetical protein